MYILSIYLFGLLGWLSVFITAPIHVVVYFFTVMLARDKQQGRKRWRKIVVHGWVKSLLWMLRVICKIDYRIEGLEHLQAAEKLSIEQGKPFMIICQHQSMMETVILEMLIADHATVLKQELTRIPFFGLCLNLMPIAALDRGAGSKALKLLMQRAKAIFDAKISNKILIFPEGTRQPIDQEQLDFNVGFAFLYKNLGTRVLPVAVNTGLFWGKSPKLWQRGTATIRFLPPIEAGLELREIQQKAQSVIGAQGLELLKQGRANDLYQRPKRSLFYKAFNILYWSYILLFSSLMALRLFGLDYINDQLIKRVQSAAPALSFAAFDSETLGAKFFYKGQGLLWIDEYSSAQRLRVDSFQNIVKVDVFGDKYYFFMPEAKVDFTAENMRIHLGKQLMSASLTSAHFDAYAHLSALRAVNDAQIFARALGFKQADTLIITDSFKLDYKGHDQGKSLLSLDFSGIFGLNSRNAMLPSAIEQLQADLAFKPALPRYPSEQALLKWAQKGGSLDIKSISTQIEDMQITLKGLVSFNKGQQSALQDFHADLELEIINADQLMPYYSARRDMSFLERLAFQAYLAANSERNEQGDLVLTVRYSFDNTKMKLLNFL